MRIVYFIIFMSFFLFTFLVLLDVFKVYKLDFRNINIFKPTKRSNDGKQAIKLSNIIKLPEFLRKDLLYKIDLLNINMTPEVYVSNCIINNIFFLFLAIGLYFVEPILGLIFLVVFFIRMYSSFDKINKDLSKKRKVIESEIPRFLSYIIQNYKTSKDILPALEVYEKNASPYFKKEINITIADMMSGGRVEALRRLDMRVNSYEFSRVIKAIISVLRGDENIDYIKILYREFQVKEVESLRRETILRPKKVEKYIILLTIIVVAMYLYVVVVQIFKEFTEILSY
ncbi:MAG: hypothetical protein IJ593_00340 [Lachnospiraceae bacterium]|nr:hypothetical protein [Lachnospiraceae bacterium]